MSKPSYASAILITGGTTGLGYSCAFSLARSRPNTLIVVASRSDANSSAATINRTLKQSNTTYFPLDLSSLQQIRSFVNEWKKEAYPPLSALVLNAALQILKGVQYTADGVEKTVGIAHVGHALLFHLLESQGCLAKDARIVVIASGVHDPAQKTGLPDAFYPSAAEIAYPSEESKKKNTGQQRYCTSKLCNVLWTYALARRLEGTRKTVVAMDPGLMPGTGLARDYPAFLKWLWVYVFPRILPVFRLLVGSKNVHTADESGAALARLAAGEDVRGVSGTYFEGRKEIKSSAVSYEREKQEDLWEWTVKFVAQIEEERKRFAKVE